MLTCDERFVGPSVKRRLFSLLAERNALLIGGLSGVPRPEPLVASPVHCDHRPREEVAGGRGQIGDQQCKLSLAAHPSKRDRVGYALHNRGGILREQGLRLELPGCQRQQANAETSPPPRKGA